MQTPKHTNVVNLSDCKLTPAMRRLFSKGLSFVLHAWPKRSNLDLHMDLDTLRNKYINKYVGAIPLRASRLLKQMLVSIQYDFGNLSLVRGTPNLSRDERSAIPLSRTHPLPSGVPSPQYQHWHLLWES